MRRAPQNGQNPLRLQLKAKCLAHAPTDAFAAHEAEGEVGLAGDFAGCAGLTDEYLPDAKSESEKKRLRYKKLWRNKNISKMKLFKNNRLR